jgi:hypothetical protein
MPDRLTDAELAEAKYDAAKSDNYMAIQQAATGDKATADQLIAALTSNVQALAERYRKGMEDAARLNKLQALVMDGAEVLRDSEHPIIFMTCGPLYVYRGESEDVLRAAIDAARGKEERDAKSR